MILLFLVAVGILSYHAHCSHNKFDYQKKSSPITIPLRPPKHESVSTYLQIYHGVPPVNPSVLNHITHLLKPKPVRALNALILEEHGNKHGK